MLTLSRHTLTMLRIHPKGSLLYQCFLTRNVKLEATTSILYANRLDIVK